MRYDRRWQYSSFSSRGGIPPGCKYLILANVAIFVVTFLGQGTWLDEHLNIFTLVPRAVVENFAVWQLVTYMFLHGGIGHILFNMLALWMFGSLLEADWGTRRFLKYYFVCGVGAGICDIALSYATGSLNTRTLGSSGAIYGLLLAIGVLYPNMEVLFMFLFPMKAKWMVLIYGGIEFLMLRVNSNTSHIAHLGGMFFGYLFIKSRARGGIDWGWAQREYQAWKLRRAKKKFQVYMRKHRGGPGDWVN